MQTSFSLPIALFFYLSLLWRYRAHPDEPTCFIVPPSHCAELKSGSKCGLSRDKFTAQVYCCNVTHDGELSSYLNKLPLHNEILGFHLRDSSLEKLEISIFYKLEKLASFSITGSNITHVSGAFDGSSPLTCLNISQNMIQEIHPYILLPLKRLRNIVITNNTNISVLPEFSKDLKGFKLDVSGNYQLSCKYLINLTLAVAQNTMSFAQINKNSTICLPPYSKVFTESSKVHVTMEHLDKVKEIVNECPTINKTEKCQCSVHSLDIKDNGTLIYHALVNCSRRGMTSFPNKLPYAIRVLDVSNNNITSFEGIGNKTFNNVRELYADNNKITSLKPLEGTTFLSQFQNLTLRNNKIDQIQVYMLSNVFDRNSINSRTIWLAKNEFKCDCHTASQTKAWLMANTRYVPDFYDIYTICGSSKMRVVDLIQKDVCQKPTDWKDFIRFVIYGELIIFVLLFGKVFYDFYIFKMFGFLPWPASRMPKLPCDLCFET